MRKINEVLRLHFEQQLGQRQIGRAINTGQSTVHDYLARFAAAGLSWPLPQPMTDDELETKLYPEKKKQPQPTGGEQIYRRGRAVPDFAHIQDELKRGKHTTLDLLWREYRDAHPEPGAYYSYSRFCHLFDQWRQGQSPVMRQQHQAGEKLFVDWAGDQIAIHGRQSSDVQTASLFVIAWGASSYTYAEATLTQTLPDWIGAHVRAFAFFGGTAELLVPDNTKTAVLKPCRYDPDLNPTYYEMAKHYGMGIVPARVRKPRDKAIVECGVLVAERWILAALRHRRFYSLAEVNEAIAELLTKLNQRPFKKRPGSRASLFAELDQPAMRPLPAEPYDQSIWEQTKVHPDYHVQVGQCFYSVPYQLVRKPVEVRATPTTIEIFHRGQRVASHVRLHQAHQASTEEAHRPPAHRAHNEWDAERITAWAAKTGPHTARLVEQIMQQFPHPEMGFRSCLGVIRRAQRYPAERVEAAAERTLAIGGRYKSFCSILEKGLDQQPLPQPPSPPRSTPPHGNIRGVQYFSGAGNSNDTAEVQ
jgi:transposase